MSEATNYREHVRDVAGSLLAFDSNTLSAMPILLVRLARILHETASRERREW